MKKIILGTILAVNLYSSNLIVEGSKAWEQFENGKEDYSSMKFGYYMGNINGIRMSVDKILFCTTKGVDNNQLAAIVRKYIKNNPEKWNEGSWSLIFNPLKKAFPCKQDKKKK